MYRVLHVLFLTTELNILIPHTLPAGTARWTLFSLAEKRVERSLVDPREEIRTRAVGAWAARSPRGRRTAGRLRLIRASDGRAFEGNKISAFTRSPTVRGPWRRMTVLDAKNFINLVYASSENPKIAVNIGNMLHTAPENAMRYRTPRLRPPPLPGQRALYINDAWLRKDAEYEYHATY